MCVACDDPNHAENFGAADRRRLILGGLAAAPFATATSAKAARKPAEPAVPDKPFPVRAFGVAAAGQTVAPLSIQRRAVGAKDVLIDILYCGVCHSDIHTARGEWGPPRFPLVTGHEFVGRVAAVGPEVTRFKVGDMAGVGCMVDSCGKCDACLHDLENYCTGGNTLTYNSADKISGGQTFGGYSERIVVTEHFVVRIPPGVDLAAYAPLLCAGVTTFSPLQHWKVERGQKVGVVGMGGLGHLAVKLAVARGAEVTVFTTSADKIPDAKRFGAREAVDWSDLAALRPYVNQFDLVIATVPKAYPVSAILNLLKRDATLVSLGDPNELKEVRGGALWRQRRSLASSLFGGIAETQEVVDYCAARGIKPEVQVIRPDQIAATWDKVVAKGARYRFVIDVRAASKA